MRVSEFTLALSPREREQWSRVSALLCDRPANPVAGTRARRRTILSLPGERVGVMASVDTNACFAAIPQDCVLSPRLRELINLWGTWSEIDGTTQSCSFLAILGACNPFGIRLWAMLPLLLTLVSQAHAAGPSNPGVC
jgi:hypothetical protein